MQESNEICEKQLFSPAVRELINSNATFDAIVIEQLWFQCYYSLVKHFDYPMLIGFLSVGNLPYAMDSIGNPDDPMLNPDMAFHFTDRMTTYERIVNLLYTTATRFYYRHWHLPRAQQIAEKSEPGTSVLDIDRNFSLVILGNNHVFGYPKPLLPNVVEVHSLQIGGQVESLPEDVREFLDGAKDGAIYFSLGSNLQTHQLPVRALTALLDALGSVRQRILWKHRGGNGDALARAANIKFVEWAPQQAVLAHANVAVYMMQGGLQSLQEAVHYAVPVIVIPFFGDQNFNARKVLDAEIGLTLDVDSMTNETIVRVIGDVVGNEKYRKNIRRMSEIIKDELVRPIDRAVWNIEHVLKFPDSGHLKYHGKEVTYLRYYLPFMIIFLLCIIAARNLYVLLRKVQRFLKLGVAKFSSRFDVYSFGKKTKLE